jgi:hypothetical protein
MATVVGPPRGKPQEHKATGPTASGCHRASSRPSWPQDESCANAARLRRSARTWYTTAGSSRGRAITPRRSIISSTSRKLSGKRWSSPTQWLMISAGSGTPDTTASQHPPASLSPQNNPSIIPATRSTHQVDGAPASPSQLGRTHCTTTTCRWFALAPAASFLRRLCARSPRW